LQDGQALETWHQNQNVFASNFVPLWLEPFHSGGKSCLCMGQPLVYVELTDAAIVPQSLKFPSLPLCFAIF